MSFKREFKREVSHGTDEARAYIYIESPGWSGKVVRKDAVDDADRSFMMNLTGTQQTTLQPSTEHATGQGSGGYVAYDASGGIIAISLEHFFDWGEDYTEGGVQTTGWDSNNDIIGAWGAKPTDNSVTITANDIFIHSNVYEYGELGEETEVTQTDISLVSARIRTNFEYINLPARIYGNWQSIATSHIVTDLPIFATDADLLAWIASDFEDVSNMLNYTTPEDEYRNYDNCWYVHNVFGHNTKDRNSYTGYRNFQFWPKTGRICFYRSAPTAADPYALKLLHYTDYDVYKGGAWDENFIPFTGSVDSNYMTLSARYGANDYYTVFVNAETYTNIPIFNSLADATDYINHLKDIEDADNYSDLAQAENEIIPPGFGDEDDSTDIGANEQSYNIAGFHLYEVSHTELSSFFLEIFNTDPNVVDAILEGTKLFSGNEINAIMMCMYLPISDISKICTMGSTSKITVGTWTADHSEGTRIAKNDVVMTMGSMYIPYRYNSEQDFEPYTQMFVQLPYCGTHQIQISKYIGKTLRCDYAVCVSDGSCKALLYGDNILLDEFAGNMGSMRPITASDAAQYVSNIVNGIMGESATVTGGANSALNHGIEAAGAGGAASVLGVAGAAVGAGIAGAQGVYKGYELLQAAETPPMSTKGGLSGGISYFGVQKPHFIIAQKEVVRPLNERQVIGYPSGQGGKVGSFSGYLKCSAFNLADGFTGTQSELNEIYEIMSKGIYL